MSKQSINLGVSPNDGTGTNLRDAGDLINDNFNEIYTAIGNGTTLTSGTFLTDSSSNTVTNKIISGSNNTLQNIPNSALITIQNSKLANSTITIGDDTSTNFTIPLGGSFEIVGGSGINTAIENNRIVLSTDGSIVTETSSDVLTNKTISGSNNTLSNIGNSSLSNSTISLGGITLNLGDTDATPALNLSDATNYPTSSLTGTITNAQLAGSIENSKLLNSTITIGDDTSTNFNVSLGGSFEIVGGSGISTAINNNRIELTVSSVPNSSLANSSFTLGSDVINLGDTTTTITGLSLDGSGTVDLTGSGSKIKFDFNGFGSLPVSSTYVGMYAFDTLGNRPYYSSGSGWVRILDENSSVSAHTDVNLTGIADGYILKWSSSQGRFNVVADSGGEVVDDTTPQLGGNLDVNSNSIVSTSNGNISITPDGTGKVIIDGLSHPTADGTSGQVLKTDGSGNLSFVTNYQSAAGFDVTNNSSSAYRFSSHYGTTNNPTIYLFNGHTYAFNLNVSGHPFHIQTVSGAYSSGNGYSEGLIHVATDGTVTTGASALLKVSGTLYWRVPASISGNYYYVCQYHSAMAGTITIKDVSTI